MNEIYKYNVIRENKHISNISHINGQTFNINEILSFNEIRNVHYSILLLPIK